MPTEFDSPGPVLSRDDVADLERKIGCKLPDDYVSFLLRWNGGVPTPNGCVVPGFRFRATDVQVFHGIRRPSHTSNVEWFLTTFPEYYSALVPIACDSFGCLFVMRVRGEHAGAIYYLPELGSTTTRLRVSRSFTELVESLRD